MLDRGTPPIEPKAELPSERDGFGVGFPVYLTARVASSLEEGTAGRDAAFPDCCFAVQRR